MKPRLLLFLVIAVLAGADQLHGAGLSLNWNPNSNSLNNDSNWANNSPTDNDLFFGVSSQFNVSLKSDLSVRSMLFTGDHPAYTFSSNNNSVLTLSTGITMTSNSVQTVTFQSSLALTLSGA